jgi:hypothetical protein
MPRRFEFHGTVICMYRPDHLATATFRDSRSATVRSAVSTAPSWEGEAWALS